MKKSLIASLLAAPALVSSPLVFASEPMPSEIVLTASQMDEVTAAGRQHKQRHGYYRNSQSQRNSTNQYQFGNINISPAIGIQVLTYDSTNNTSSGGISQGNTAFQFQF